MERGQTTVARIEYTVNEALEPITASANSATAKRQGVGKRTTT